MKVYSFGQVLILLCFSAGIFNTAIPDTALKLNAGKFADTLTHHDIPKGANSRERLEDAWWTGPLLTPSASTLTHGHFLIEPYLFDVTKPNLNGLGSLTYILYGVTNRLTMGIIPTGGYNKVNNGPSSSGIQVGDMTLTGQFRITQFEPGSWEPTISFVLQESLPTGKFDKLDPRFNDGFGNGAYTTTLAVYMQTYFWLQNAHILRVRFDAMQSFSSIVNVRGVSVYGTTAAFNGLAAPGNSFAINSSSEYSLSQRFVLAFDVIYRLTNDTHITGSNINLKSSGSFGFAPALEYSWNANWGVLFGTRFIMASRSTPASITPAVGVNFVY